MDSKLGKPFSFVTSKKNNSSQNLTSIKPPLQNTGSSSSILSKLSPFGIKSQPITPIGSPPQTNSPPNQHEKKPSSEQQLFNDITQVRTALDYFLDSHISEAEAILKPHYKDSMYYSLGYSFILYLKCVMTFQPDDINAALGVLKHTIGLAGNQRKKDSGWFDSITSWVKGTTLEDVKQMTTVERHAELVYAEAYLLKALLSIIYDESVMSFLRESLNIRSSYNSYMTLEKYIDYMKSEGKMEELDHHFTSGVGLGVGCFSLILSMLPASVVKVAEFIGFSSDRAHGLHVLESVGGWDDKSSLTRNTSDLSQTGLRSQLCDMILIVYHVVLSKMVPLSDVDIPFAERIINDCLSHYPRGVFYLFFNGRLMVTKKLLKEAEEQYQKAIDIQKDWKQLQHMCFWELGLIYMMKQEWQKAYDLYRILGKESNWSKAVYTYLKAINLYMLADETKDEAVKTDYMQQVVSFMEQVTGEKQKIAGKSIPMEKFVARKARKFLSQDNYLLLPDLEMLNAFTAYDFMPVNILQNDMKRIDEALTKLSNTDENANKANHYDDVCLAQFLRAITARMLYEQEAQDKEEMNKIHKEALQVVFVDANKIHLDHYIYYFGHYEKARMLMNDKGYKEAEANIQVVLKANDRGHYGVGAGPHAKNKYSLASALVFKCHNCMSQIKAESKQ